MENTQKLRLLPGLTADKVLSVLAQMAPPPASTGRAPGPENHLNLKKSSDPLAT